MKKYTKQLSNFIKWFLSITSGILIICAICYSLEGSETLNKNTLWDILLSGFLTTFVTWLLAPGDNSLPTSSHNPIYRLPEKLIFPVQILLHYAALCAVMLPCGIMFGWTSLTLPGLLLMMLYVAAVYAIVFGVTYIIDIRDADAINRKIKEQYKE